MEKTQVKINLENVDKSILETIAREKNMSITGLVNLVVREYLEAQQKEIIYALFKRGKLTL